MKKIYFAIIALSACAFVACNEIGVEIVNDAPGTVEMTVVAGDATSKTALSGTKIIWSGSEKLKVIEAVTGGTDNDKFFSKDSSEGVSGDEGKTMSFNVTLDSHDGATSFQYVALYPNTAFFKATSLSNIAVNSLSAQDPSATGFDPAADFLISQVSDASASQPTSINMAFARKIAIAEMTIKNLDSSDDITSVTFSALKKDGGVYKDVVVAGRSKVDFTTSSVDYGSNVKSFAITMDYTGDNVKANTSSGAKTYFTCYPFSLAADDQFTVVVETATHRFTKEITLAGAQTLEFTPGNVSRFSVNMSGVVPTINAQDIPYAVLSYEAAVEDGLSTSYTTHQHTDIVGGKWEYNAYKGTGIQIKNCSTDANKSSYIKLPEFKDNIRKVVINLAAEYNTKSLRFDSTADSYAGGIYTLNLDENKTYTLTATELGSIKNAYIHAYGQAVNIASIEVYAGTDISTPLGTPSGVTAVLTDDGAGGTIANSVTVGWDAVDHANYYTVTLTPTSSGDPVSKTVNTTTATIADLSYETTYAVAVVAHAYNKGLYLASSAGTCSNITTDKEPSGTTYYVKVTNAATLAADDQIIFVYESSNVAMSTTQNGNNRGQTAVTITASKIASDTLPAAVQVITLEGSSSAWKFNVGDGYLYSPSANNYLRTQASNNDYGKWTISITDGNATINCIGRTEYYIEYNSSSSLFSCYKQTQKKVQIYKLDD